MHRFIIQRTVAKVFLPKNTDLRTWAKSTLENVTTPTETTIRIVSREEMTTLNERYRKKVGHTNVLSFPFEVHEDVDLGHTILGDIVICADVVNDEALQQQKDKQAHWAHMVIHGMLHLQGYDHEDEDEAHVMETREITIMEKLKFPNPYTK
ncbi:MAG: rRNA maturation RNase YbeY [Gammaproteobacteria bacterium]|nr:rRNA maturation RNase YbeY [Gammaproteobacteria bacterium]